MIDAPVGWKRQAGANVTSYYPPEGGARIRCYERIRPLMSFARVIEVVLARDPEFRATSMRDVQSIITGEGEYGAWARIDGIREGRTVVRFVAAVFADEYVLALDAFVLLAKQRTATIEATRKMLHEARLQLGLRARRFLYRPPSGWSAVPSGLVATWYPPGFPRAWATLVVMPAEPTMRTTRELVDVEGLIAAEAETGAILHGGVEEADLETASGMGGRRCAFAMRSRTMIRHHEIAAVASGSYVYVMRMETREETRSATHHETFLATARSIVAVPGPGRSHIPPISDLSSNLHWVD